MVTDIPHVASKAIFSGLVDYTSTMSELSSVVSCDVIARSTIKLTYSIDTFGLIPVHLSMQNYILTQILI